MGLITAVLTCQGQSTVYLGMLPTVVGASSRDTVRPRAPPPHPAPSELSVAPPSCRLEVFLPERGSALRLPQENGLLRAEALAGKQWRPASQ